MHLMYYTNEEGHRVYTLKVPPFPAAAEQCNSAARGAAHAKRAQASVSRLMRTCSVRRRRLRTAGRRNPRTPPASRPMTSSPSSGSSARSASASCLCSARRWPCNFDTCALVLHVLPASTVTCPIRCRLLHACTRTVVCDISLLSAIIRVYEFSGEHFGTLHTYFSWLVSARGLIRYTKCLV